MERLTHLYKIVWGSGTQTPTDAGGMEIHPLKMAGATY